MTAAHVTVNGTGLLADPSGAVMWPAESLLIVADLHLEKGSSFAARGRFLPPYDTAATLARLGAVLRRYRPRRVACLGDSFHDRGAALRIGQADLDALNHLVFAHDWTWVLGNHDPEVPAAVGGARAALLAVAGLILRHQPAPRLDAGGLCGHFHPKASVTTRARRFTGPCFVTDGERMILPAFGAYAGGLDVFDPAIAGQFGRAGFRVFFLRPDRLHMFPRDRLERPPRMLQAAAD